jgi:HAD superfamily hydrolase (TIGR01509 family)
MIQNILFDLDGVLFDGAPLHRNVFLEAVNTVSPESSLTNDFHDRHLNGLSTKQKLTYLVDHNIMSIENASSIQTLKQTLTWNHIEKLELNPERLVTILKVLKQSYSLFCVTNSIRKTTEIVLKKLGIYDYFTGIVTNEDVTEPKPNGEIYQTTFQKYSLEPFTCLILEDSQFGRTAAFSTHAHVLPIVDTTDVTLEIIQDAIQKINIPRHITNRRKVNIVVPMAGHGSRFSKQGYTIPKPFIPVFGKPMIQWVIENIIPTRERYGSVVLEPTVEPIFHFIAQESHLKQYSLDSICTKMNIQYTITTVKQVTEGPACTVLLTKHHINTNDPLITINSDQFLDWDCNEFYRTLLNPYYDGCISTFYQPNSSDCKWSYAKLDKNGCVTDVAEKKYISNLATTGIYGWKKGSDFVAYAEQMIQANDRVNNEFYVCPVYSYLLRNGGHVRTYDCKKLWGLGVPEDLEHFLQYFPGNADSA